MSKSTGSYPSLIVDTTAQRAVSHAGAVLLAATASRIGLDRELSAALRPWMRPLAVHNPGKVLLDLAIAVAIGGDCLADIAQVRSEPGVFGHVASDPTVSRLIDTLAADAPAALAAINTARATVRARVWELAGTDAPDDGATAKDPLIVDLDATLITAHSEKELAAATFKRGFGHHPIGAWVDHGPGGTGEPVAMLLRKGNAGCNTAVDHIEVTKAALRQLPSTDPGRRPGKKILIRTDGAGGTHEFLNWLTTQRLAYSVGFTLTWTWSRSWKPSRIGVDPGVRRRPQTTGRGVGHRTDRAARPVRLARRDAGHRPRGTTAPRCATAVHRFGRQPAHRVRHEHHPRATPRPGTAAPAARPV